MKALKVAAIATALVAASIPASAVTFFYTGALVTYVVPADHWYQLTVAGAQGGGLPSRYEGGAGALISGYALLAAGTTLTVLAGGAGFADGNNDSGGSGGGLSFVSSDTNPLIVAGAGGGGSRIAGDGGPGLFGPSGNGSGSIGYHGGAGWFSPADHDPGAGYGAPTWAGGVGSPAEPDFGYFEAAPDGAFGGGGGAGLTGGGGGAGYTGGLWMTDFGVGQGGTSFTAPELIKVSGSSGFNFGDGWVTINFASGVPEPSTWALLIVGFGMCGTVLRRGRRHKLAIRR